MSTAPEPSAKPRGSVPLTITLNRLVAIMVLVWLTTLLCSTGVAWFAATVSADRTNQANTRDQCQSRQRARNTAIDNAVGNQGFYVSQVKEAKREITQAKGEIKAREASPDEVRDAHETIKRNTVLLAHVPTITVPATVSC